jgi:hypothetical protein
MNSVDPQELSKAMALISIAGFAIQRSLELLDPFLALLSNGLSSLGKKVNKKEVMPFGLTEKELKAWLIALISFLIGLIIAGTNSIVLLKDTKPVWNQLVIALAISLGTNGVNSLFKYTEYAKDARRVEVKSLPVITIIPNTSTIKTGAQTKFLASLAGTDNQAVTWKVLESGGGTIDAEGLYTAPTQPGTYHVAATSLANEAASNSAVVTVQ